MNAELKLLDKRITVIEEKAPEQFNFINWRLTAIENSLAEINKSLDDVRSYLDKHEGGLAAKTKIWFAICSFLTIITALGLHSLVYKIFGVDL
jgi:hypothetical protein